MHPHFTMTFPSFHFTTLTHPSHTHHSLLPFPSHHFTSFSMTAPTPSLRPIYHFPNPFPKIKGNTHRHESSGLKKCGETD
jgi:hypothetical protein